MKNDQYELPASLASSLEAMINGMVKGTDLETYLTAQTKLDSNEEANCILQRLNSLQTQFRQKQYSGQISQDDINELRETQRQAQENEIISHYAKSQQKGIDFLRKVNTEISQLIGMDFADLSKKNKC